MRIRQATEELETQTLSRYAVLSSRTRGRDREEDPHPIRTAFQRDRDRIIHSKAFRRLKDKTQVFIAPAEDHYRTRMTHTLEVAQISRTVAKALRLNEDLTEGIALGHDLGHTPFGHSGEALLNRIVPGGFRHARQSLRMVERLEQGCGLNLTLEVRDGIVNHSGNLTDFPRPITLEGQIVKICDRVAYINHDIDDAMRAGILQLEHIPADLLEALGQRHSQRINTLVRDLIESSWDQAEIRMSPRVFEAMDRLHTFLFERVYIGSAAKREEDKAQRLLEQLYHHYLEHGDLLPPETAPAREAPAGSSEHTLHRRVCDYVAGMSDRYAITQYERYFLPSPWRVPG
jgi:dGTPase